MLTLAGDRVCAITGFNDNSVLAGFGLPRTLPEQVIARRFAVTHPASVFQAQARLPNGTTEGRQR